MGALEWSLVWLRRLEKALKQIVLVANEKDQRQLVLSAAGCRGSPSREGLFV